MCLEKGDSSLAHSALDWLKEEQQFPKVGSTNMVFVASLGVHVEVGFFFFLTDVFFPQGLSVKLTTVVKKGDAYHPLLMSFSYSRLLEMVQSYIDAYLRRNPSDYLIKVHNLNLPHTSVRVFIWSFA